MIIYLITICDMLHLATTARAGHCVNVLAVTGFVRERAARRSRSTLSPVIDSH